MREKGTSEYLKPFSSMVTLQQWPYFTLKMQTHKNADREVVKRVLLQVEGAA